MLLHFCGMNYDFPQYRKLKNEKSFYFIESLVVVHEVQQMGNRWTEHTLKAKILPERLHISDILEGTNGIYLTITKEEFEKFKTNCINNLKLF